MCFPLGPMELTIPVVIAGDTLPLIIFPVRIDRLAAELRDDVADAMLVVGEVKDWIARLCVDVEVTIPDEVRGILIPGMVHQDLKGFDVAAGHRWMEDV